MADANDQQEPVEENEMPQEETPTNEIQFNFNDGQVSCLGQDVDRIPQQCIDKHAQETKRLDLSFNRLQSLAGLENFLNLEMLVLDNNELSDDLHFPRLPYLHTITLNKNKITNLDDLLENLKSQLPGLSYLSLLGNTACPNQLSSSEKDDEDYQRYRYYVLYHLPKLKFLDSSPVKASEVAESKRVGPFMKVVKPGIGEEQLSESSPEEEQFSYTPLPDKGREEDNHAGTYGKSKYIYYGRHSEGNRFIRNNDL